MTDERPTTDRPTNERAAYYRRLRAIFDDCAETRGGYYDAPPTSATSSASDRATKGQPAKRHRHTIWQRLNRLHIHRILAPRVRDMELRSCLDVGCGNGDFSHELGERFDFERVHGIDLSSSVIDIARQRYIGSAPPAALSFSVEDVASGLPFSDREFDLVCCLNVFHHLLPGDQEAVIGHLCRVASRMVVLEVKRYHFLPRLLTGYRAMGMIDIYPVRIPAVLACFAAHGFRPVVIRPIFYVLALSPIAVLALVREEER